MGQLGRHGDRDPGRDRASGEHRGGVRVVLEARERGLTVKAVGSGHSFTPVAVTDGVLVQLDRLRGIVSADVPSGVVRVRAGTPLHQLNDALAAVGLAMPNLGDIDRQTISGALGTGTHGTGARFRGPGRCRARRPDRAR